MKGEILTLVERTKSIAVSLFSSLRISILYSSVLKNVSYLLLSRERIFLFTQARQNSLGSSSQLDFFSRLSGRHNFFCLF